MATTQTHWLYRLPIWSLCVLMLLPAIFLVKSWWQVDTLIWQHLWDTQLLGLIKNTLILVLGVGIGVSVLGVSFAWLTAVCEFPGRKFFDWALILPLAVPAYVLAFVTLGIFDFGGTAQSFLRSIGMQGYLEVRTPFTVVCVMTMVLYPYVYLLARAAFLAQGTELLNVARTLGLRPFPAFFRVVLPAARSAIVAGVSLALMETLADFGAVAIFGFNTFTTAIYKSWFSLFSIETAAQLATLLLLFVILAMTSEMYFRPRKTEQESQVKVQDRLKLSRPVAWLATSVCTFVFLLAVALPLLQLLIWSINNLGYLFAPEFSSLVLRTFSLGAIAALIVLILAFPFAFAVRRSKSALLPEVAGWGYAIPGSVLAVGIMSLLASADRFLIWQGQLFGLSLEPIFLGSLFGMLFAYVVRFFRPGYGALASGLRRVKQSYIESAVIMGSSRRRIFFGISLPLLMPGFLTGALIVFVDVIKEMPASLLLRPFGWDTLAVKIYELTSEGEWERAGLSALVLVLVSLIPVALLIRQSRVSSLSR